MTALNPPADVDAAALPPVQYYIPETSSRFERRTRTLKHDNTFVVFDHYGNIMPKGGESDGLFHHDMRHLSDWRFLINERYPLLLSSTIQDNNALLMIDLTNPDFMQGHELTLQKDVIHISRSIFLWNGACCERINIHNFSDERQLFSIKIFFDADFLDIFEVRGYKRDKHGKIVKFISEGKVVFTYYGLDGVTRHTIMGFDPPPTTLNKRSAAYAFDLAPHQKASLFCRISCEVGEVRPPIPPSRFFFCLRAARRDLRNATAAAAVVQTSNEIFNRMLCRSMADLAMLTTKTSFGLYPYAGIPWFSAPFGRDALITAIETLWMDPRIAKGVLTTLATHQARETKPEADEEPGKILHEARFGEMAALGEVPFGRYYGSVDSTPLFVWLAGLYFEQTGDMETISFLWPHIEAALKWIDETSALNSHGFLTYNRGEGQRLANQGWKDSTDAIFHENGNDAMGRIALCEVQGYAYAAKRAAAKVAGAIGFSGHKKTLQREARELRSRFETQFWCPEKGIYALALDGENQPCKIRTSNAGQLLFSGIIDGERAALIATQLLNHSFFSGWGIRTLAVGEPRYNPMSYHNGSVWPHDNALIGYGLARYGLKQHLLRLFNGLFDAATYMELYRLPELFCGFRRAAGKGPTFYPVACSPQAWSSGVPFALLQACLGLDLNFATRTVCFHKPRLPPFLDEVIIRDLKIANSEFDILFRRYGADVSVNVLRRTGDAQVVVTV